MTIVRKDLIPNGIFRITKETSIKKVRNHVFISNITGVVFQPKLAGIVMKQTTMTIK